MSNNKTWALLLLQAGIMPLGAAAVANSAQWLTSCHCH
jgi:hypothetical protein